MAALAAAVCQDVGVGGTIVWPAPDVRGWMRAPGIARVLRHLHLGELARYLAARAARDGITLINAGEDFSTRACAHCQTVGPKVAGRWFRCAACGHDTHRDGGGANQMGKHAFARAAQVLAGVAVTARVVGAMDALLPAALHPILARAATLAREPAVAPLG